MALPPQPPPQPPPSQSPSAGSGYYPQQAYYAPGWTAPPGRAGGSTGRAVAIVLAVVVGIAAIGVGAVAALRWNQVRALGEITSPINATGRQVGPGHCIAELGEDGPVHRVRLVPCDQPHEAEVVGTLPLRDEAWPGQAAVERQAVGWCELDSAQRAAGAEAVSWLPTEGGWAAGDRTVICIVRSTTGPVTGSWTAGQTPS